MADILLDKHPGSRRYVAHLSSFGATRAQICAKLAEKYPMRSPTTRSMTKWLNEDPELVKMIADLDAIKADMAPDDPALAELPEPVDMAQATSDLFGMAVKFPAFGRLLARPDDDDFDGARAMSQVLAAEHDSGESFEAACATLVGDWDPHVPNPGAGSLS